jgi:4-diphosphocytidyl-2-C-methyl-D-erythritol kinase
MEKIMDSIRLKARAKVNLGLDVLGKREDGYHEVRMVMQTVGIYDRLILTKIPEDEIRIVSNLSFLPVNENNLIYKAAKLLQDEYHFEGGVQIDLNKFIPVAAGMAGGSTDAASTMFGINRLFELGMSQDRMMELGVRLGADVPYCVMRGTALAEGIGEKLTRLSPMPHCWMLVAKPPINVSTKLVYESLDMDGVNKHPDIDGIIHAIEQKNIAAVAAKMENVLEQVTIPLYPVIDTIKKDMMKHGAINAMMSGSGPTVFGIFPDERTALQCQLFLKQKGDARQVYITETFN